MEKNYNEDYVKGMKFLLNKSKEQGINIRRCMWIPHVSKMLSERNLCYKFWYNVWVQNRLDKVPLCKNWYDVMYVPERWLFLWSVTREGSIFWRKNLWGMLGLSFDDNSLSVFLETLQTEILQGMELK